jgi:UDP-N-acetylmuramoyl-tripeptide--D-alanyl-D-alanine ligase
VAIAGSAGKTTTRAAVGAVLEATCPGQVHATPGNLNNRVGVPLVLLGLRPEHRYAVVEVGTNATGEVAELNRVASPEVGVLTLVGLEHAAGLGELDAIEREEGSLLGDLPPSGIAVANGDDVRAVRQLDRSRAGTHVRYGTLPGCDVRLASRQATSDHLTRLVLQRASQPGQIEVDCRLMGLPGALAVAAGVAVADCLMPGILGQELIASALERLGSGEPGRLTPRSGRDGTLILDDSYNSNPASLYASLEAAREAASRRHSRLLLVLGEMRELGSLSGQEHASVGRALRQGEVLVGVAGEFRRAVAEARAHGHSAEFVEDADEAIETVESRMSHGDVILIKGSRSVGLELVVQALTTGREGTA